jgi:hypothetical protein
MEKCDERVAGTETAPLLRPRAGKQRQSLQGDRPDEPLEITRFADRDVMTTWARLERADREAPLLTRDWAVDVPSRIVDATESAPYDLRAFFAEAEPALAAHEAAGYDSFDLGVWNDDPAVAEAREKLIKLGCNFGFSNEVPAGEVARVIPGASVGGVVEADSLASAVEVEAAKDDNRAKLRKLPDAQRRHICVVIDASSGTAFSAASHALTGRAPVLPEPITTAWVAGGGSHIFEVTPPDDWHTIAVPQDVFDHPERWIDPS